MLNLNNDLNKIIYFSSSNYQIDHGHLVIPDDSTIQKMNQNGHMDLFHRYVYSVPVIKFVVHEYIKY